MHEFFCFLFFFPFDADFFFESQLFLSNTISVVIQKIINHKFEKKGAVKAE